MFICDIGMQGEEQSLFKENDCKLRWRDQTRPNWSDDRGIDWVSDRNNWTLLEHFMSNTRHRQHPSRGEFYFTDLFLISELRHHSSPTSTSDTTHIHTHTHHRFSSHLGTTKCLCALYLLCGDTCSHNVLDSVWAGYPVCPSFFPCWGPQTCWTSQTWHHATDGMHVTGSPWWQHFISAIMLSVFSGYLRFGLLITQFLDFKLSALVFEAFQTVWMEWIDERCSASVRQIQGES